MTQTIAITAAAAIAGAVGFGIAPLAAAQSACGDLGGTVDAAQVCHVDITDSGYRFEASFPSSYPDQQAVVSYVTGQRHNVASYAAKFPPSGRPSGYELTITSTRYSAGTPTAGTRSVVFAAQNDTGAANEDRPATSYTAFNYDLGTVAPITFSTLFKPGTTPADVRVAAPILPAPDDFGVHGYRNFALTDDAVIIFIDRDFLHEQSPAHLSVPRSALAALLASPG